MKKILSLVAIVFAIALFANNADAKSPNSNSSTTTTINTDTEKLDKNIKRIVSKDKNGTKTVIKTRSPIMEAIADRIRNGGKNK